MTISRTHRPLVRALALAAALAGCSGEAPAPAPAVIRSPLFPAIADGAFKPIICAGPDAGDVALDPVTGNVDRDMIGSAAYPAFYRHGDASNVYFRIRLDGKPTKNNGTLQPSSYDVLIDTDGNLDTYEYMLTADGNLGTGGAVHWVRNTTALPSDPTDTAETVLNDLTPATDYYDAKQAADGSSFNGDPDWFITLRLPKTLLAAAGIDLSRSFVVWGGTNARNYSLNSDFGCFTSIPTTLSQAASQPVNLDPDGQPVAVADVAAAAEDASATVAVLANDGGLRDAPLGVTISAPPANGLAVVNAGNTVTYTPVADWSGTDTFTYRVQDAQGQFATAVVTVTITPVNDGPPVAVADTLTTSKGVAGGVDVLANDTVRDAPGTVAIVAGPGNGTTAVSGATVTYTPAAGYAGADAFTYRVTDADGQTASATVTVTVTATNGAPTAAADALGTAEDAAGAVDVLANDGDPDGDALAIASVTQGAHGAVSFAGGTVTYTPAADWSGSDAFTYTVSDGKGGSASATVTVTVTPVNDAPVAGADAVTVAEDGAVGVSVLANDGDVDGDALAIASVTQGARGTVSFAGATVTYTPAADWSGPDAFTYTVGDGNGGSATATVTVTVTPVNDAPIAAADAASVAEDGAAGVDVLANDGDADGDTLAIASVTQGAHGTVSLAGATATYTPAADWSGTDSFTYTAADGKGGSASATVTITVTPVNDAPVAADDAATVLEDGAVSLGVVANDTDADGDALAVTAVTQGAHGAVSFAGGTVTYTPAPGWSGDDAFDYTVSDGSGSGGTATATVAVTVTSVNDAPVALDGAATVAEDGAVEVDLAVLASDVDGDPVTVTSATPAAHGEVTLVGGTVTYVPEADWHGTDAFDYVISDGQGGVDVGTVTVVVTPVNDAPVAVDDAATVPEEGSVAVGVLANDLDVDGDGLTLAGVTQGAHGTVTFAAGVATYLAEDGWEGTDAFTYVVDDGNGGTAVGTVTITVTAGNRVPVANADAATVAEDGPAAVSVLANDTDEDGDALAVVSVTQGAHGTVTFAGGTLTYSPAPDWSGTDAFTYAVSDGKGGTATATVTVTVTPVNDVPVAVDDAAAVLEDGAVSVTVLANDTDPEGDALATASVTQGAHGTVSFAGGTVTYSPAPDWSGTDAFTYAVSDGNGGTAVGTVTVTVTPVNDAPVAVDDAATVLEDGAVDVDLAALASDVDGDALTVSTVTPAAHGQVTLVGGTVTYVPDASWHGVDAFDYLISDGRGGTAFATVTVTVTPVNDAPVALDGAATVAEDGAVDADLAALASDVDGDPVTVASVTPAAHGAVTLVGGTATYVPDASWHGTDTFDYLISDGQGGTAVATVTVVVTPVNDAPVAMDDAATLAEDGAAGITVVANDGDVDGDALVVASVTQGGHGAVTFAGGTVTYTPAASWSGIDSFTYTVSDGNGGSATATVAVTVNAVNDAPVAAGDAAVLVEDGSVGVTVLVNDTDPDADTLAIASVTQGANGAVSFSGGTVTYTPAANWNGADAFTYTVSDGSGGTAVGTVTVTVTPVNDAPVAGGDAATVAEDGSVEVTVLVNDTDVDGDTLTIASVTQGANGSVSFSSGAVTYTPAARWSGSDSFSYTVADGHGGTAIATVTVDVTAVNDAPVAAGDAATVAEDASVDIAVLANDSDEEGEALAVTAVTQGAHGAVALAGGTVTYTPDPDYAGEDGFTYTVSDGQGGSATATVTVTVEGANDAPVANDQLALVAEDELATVDVLAVATDPDGDALAIAGVTQGGHGTVTVSGGTVEYVPEADWSGIDSFTVTVEDGQGGTTTLVVTVTVTALDDAVVAADDSATVAEDAATGVNVAVLANDRLADGAAAAEPIRVVAQPAHGAVTLEDDRSFTYRPAADYAGADTFSYAIEDADGDVATATVTLTVTPVNDAPVARDDSLGAYAGGGATPIDVLANDVDVDGDTLSVTAVTQGAHGAVAIAGGAASYAAAAGYVGPDSFTYTVDDGQGGTATATVTVTVSLDPAGTPVAAADSSTTSEDAPVVVDVLANDAGLRDGPLAVSIVAQPAGAVVVVNGDGTITFTPPADASGTFELTYAVTDQDGEVATATVAFTVTAVNDAPQAADDTVSVQAGRSVRVDVLANDVDADGDALTLASVTQGGSGGAVAIVDGAVRYTPAAAFVGTDTFTYVVGDGQGGVATGTVTVEVGTDDADGDGLRDQYGIAGGGCSSAGGDGTGALVLGVLGLVALRARWRRAGAGRRPA